MHGIRSFMSTTRLGNTSIHIIGSVQHNPDKFFHRIDKEKLNSKAAFTTTVESNLQLLIHMKRQNSELNTDPLLESTVMVKSTWL